MYSPRERYQLSVYLVFFDLESKLGGKPKKLKLQSLRNIRKRPACGRCKPVMDDDATVKGTGDSPSSVPRGKEPTEKISELRGTLLPRKTAVETTQVSSVPTKSGLLMPPRDDSFLEGRRVKSRSGKVIARECEYLYRKRAHLEEQRKQLCRSITRLQYNCKCRSDHKPLIGTRPLICTGDCKVEGGCKGRCGPKIKHACTLGYRTRLSQTTKSLEETRSRLEEYEDKLPRPSNEVRPPPDLTGPLYSSYRVRAVRTPKVRAVGGVLMSAGSVVPPPDKRTLPYAKGGRTRDR